MLIHVQRESGLAHHTMTLRPWQVQILRVVASKWFVAILAVGVLSWGYFAVQAARLPFLHHRVTVLEQDALRLDTLQRRLKELQVRYDQVQKMLSTPSSAPSARPSAAPMSAPKNP
ncbi:MAG: hypothetical protein DUW69_001821 [Verrucomicrobia bacterium]|nr:MAG: hypothetical protein DUW69_001821 [Verrucomicrobiota bacterium]